MADCSVGAELLAADMADPCYAIGFNAGALGIPDPVAQAVSLRLIRHILVNRADLTGRNWASFIDQPVANYVAYRPVTSIPTC